MGKCERHGCAGRMFGKVKSLWGVKLKIKKISVNNCILIDFWSNDKTKVVFYSDLWK